MDDMALGYALGQDVNSGCNNGGGMWGGDGSWIFAFLIIALIFGGNGWGGFGGNGNNGANAFLPYAIGANGAVTRADLCDEFNANRMDNALQGVSQGLCDGFYAVNTSLLNGFHGVDNAVCTLGYQTQQGFSGVNNAICTLGYQNAQLINGVNTNMMQGFTGVQNGLNSLANQIQSCCCETNRAIERGFCDTNYNMATNTNALQVQMANNTRDIIDSQNSGTRAILDWLCNKETADLRAENQSLKLAASQAAQNTYLVNTLRPTAQPSYIVCNPYTGLYGGYGYNGYNGYNGQNNGCCGNTCC